MLKGKTAIVTGGSRGIGAAICKRFAEQGANIALLYAGNTQKAEETKAALQEMGVKAEASRLRQCCGYQSERRFLYDQAALPCFHETEKRQDYQYQLCIWSDG